MPALTEKQKEYQRSYYIKNREKKLEYLHQWRLENPDKVKNGLKDWRLRHKNYKKEQYWKDPESARKKHNEYYNRAKINFTEERRKKATYLSRQWRSRNRDRSRELGRYHQELRRITKLAVGGACSLEQWIWRCEFYGYRCAYCGKELTARTATMDHVIPLSKGGPHFPSNLVPACLTCNSSKRNNIWLPSKALKGK